MHILRALTFKRGQKIKEEEFRGAGVELLSILAKADMVTLLLLLRSMSIAPWRRDEQAIRLVTASDFLSRTLASSFCRRRRRYSIDLRNKRVYLFPRSVFFAGTTSTAASAQRRLQLRRTEQSARGNERTNERTPPSSDFANFSASFARRSRAAAAASIEKGLAGGKARRQGRAQRSLYYKPLKMHFDSEVKQRQRLHTKKRKRLFLSTLGPNSIGKN